MTSATATVPRKPPLMVRMLNPVVKPLLRSRLHGMMSGKVVLLSFSGRKSGQRYATPVGYAQPDERTLLLGTFGRWWRNLRGGAPVTVWLRGVERQATATPISDVDGVIEGFRQINAASPSAAKTLGRANKIGFGPDGQPMRDDIVRAHANGLVIVRVSLA
jgi:hypothetical protein